jgi:SAM-dependent methyltransferase
VHPLLREALRRTGIDSGRALDLGAGAHGESRFLAARGLSVDAVDQDPIAVRLGRSAALPGLTVHQRDVRDFPIRADTYDVVVALHVLPFLPGADLPAVASAIVAGLRPGGVLCVTLFGPRDSWVTGPEPVTGTTEREAAALFPGMQPLHHVEREHDGPDAEGTPKHWHVLGQVLRRPGPQSRGRPTDRLMVPGRSAR